MTDQRNFDWENIYKNTKVTDMPWYYPDLDNDLRTTLDRLCLSSGTFLDLGTGPATQANRLAELGFEVTGTDISTAAIQIARQTYKNIELLQDDILDSKLTKKFDYIFDRGCFHVIDESKRWLYVKNVFSLLNDSGLLFLKCFSDKMTETGFGPYLFSEQMILDLFDQYFVVGDIQETEFKNERVPATVHSLFVILKKR